MRKWIVVVDDDADMHYLYERVFAKLGEKNNLKQFSTGEDALAFLRLASRETRMILSDINMPVMSGLELRERINTVEDGDYRIIPFIFFSTSARDKEVKQAYQLSVQGFFQKGNTIEELENSVRIVLNYWGKCTLPEYSAVAG